MTALDPQDGTNAHDVQGACSCPPEEEWGSAVEPPPDPHCPLHGERPVADVDVDDGPPDVIDAPPGPPPMPTPPEHPGDTGCDPQAMTIHPELGWVCMECAVIIGGDQEHAAPAADTDPGGAVDYVAPGRELARADPIGDALRVLDPTQVYGPQECADQLLYMIEKLNQAEFAQRSATHRVTEAETAYRRAYDAAVVKRRGQGSADVRAAEARMEADTELTELELAKGMLSAIKAAGHSWRSMISGYQSAARLVQDAYQTTGRYQ